MSSSIGPDAVATQHASGRWREAMTQFASSHIATTALLMFVGIIVAAVLAPWLSPQDPYDLNVIDVRDGRLPPGSARFSEPRSVALRARVPTTGGAAVLRSTRKSDADVIGDLALRAHIDAADARRLMLSLDLASDSELAPLRSLTLTGLPRGASIETAVKDKFRPRWTIDPAQLANIEIVLPGQLSRDLRLRIGLSGGERRRLMTYWLGTDAQGRDVLSAILYGLRISLAVAVTSVLIALTIGTLLGLYAAYFGGRFDSIVMRIVDLQLSFPTILVALILLAVLGKGVGNVMLALVIVQWAFYARTARGVGLAERRKEYMQAGRCLALPTWRLIGMHLLPNCMPSLIVVATLQVAGAISLEATLSFLGLGLPVTQPSLGLLIANGFEYLLSGYPWISVIPGAALLITVVSINLIGDELRDILNPRLKT